MKHCLFATMWVALFGVGVCLMKFTPTGGWWSALHLANGLFMVLCVFMFADSAHKARAELPE